MGLWVARAGKARQAFSMRAGIVVSVTPQDRVRLETSVVDRNSRQKHAARSRVIVATADGCGTSEIMCSYERSSPPCRSGSVSN